MNIHDRFPRVDPPRGAVVVGVDGSSSAERAVRWAARLASARNRPLHVVHAVALASIGSTFADAYLDVPEVIDALQAGGRALLDRATAIAADEDPEILVSTELSFETPVATLLRLSSDACQLTLGEPAHSSGSTATAVANHAMCPVVVVRGDAHRIGFPLVGGVEDCPAGALPRGGDPAVDDSTLRTFGPSFC
jgi:nucleotide-binding universal stress UspA family protein